jgi:hypothetical protein
LNRCLRPCGTYCSGRPRIRITRRDLREPPTAPPSTNPAATRRDLCETCPPRRQLQLVESMPTSVWNLLHRPVECPPAPRKPVWVPSLPSTPANKRSRPSPPSSAALAHRAFFPVARPHHRVPHPAAQEADPRGVTLARRTGQRGSDVWSAIGRGDAFSQ